MGNLESKSDSKSASRKNAKRTRKREREDGGGFRTIRLQELIRDELNALLRNEIRDPRLGSVVVTMVELAGDGACARIWFTAETDDNEIEALEGAAGFLRCDLAESLGLKRTPELRFRRDPATRLFTPGAPGLKENL